MVVRPTRMIQFADWILIGSMLAVGRSIKRSILSTALGTAFLVVLSFLQHIDRHNIYCFNGYIITRFCAKYTKNYK